MQLETVTDKQLQELERLAAELYMVMRQAKLHGEPLAEALREFERAVGDTRRERYDARTSQYNGY